MFSVLSGRSRPRRHRLHRRTLVVEHLEARELLSITPLTNTAVDHRWPSLNNQGDFVYSSQVGGLWQVFKNNAQVTSDSHNNEYPSIADNGDILYFKDGGSSGNGWQIVRLSGGSESTVEFSSRNGLAGRIGTRTSIPTSPATGPASQATTFTASAAAPFRASASMSAA